MRAFTLGSYNWQGCGVGDGPDDQLRRQLGLLADVRADAWLFQECEGWRDSAGQTLFLAEQILGLRGFVAASSPRGGDLAVFVKESAGLRVTAEEHEDGYPFCHAPIRLGIATPWPGASFQLVTAHLAPTSPTIRLAEAEALAALADDGLVIAGGSWNALAAADPEPTLTSSKSNYGHRVLDRSAASAIEESGFADVAAFLRDLRPTVGHAGGLRYRCDRIYSTFPLEAIVSYEVIEEYEPVSAHRPVVATFDIEAAKHPLSSEGSRLALIFQGGWWLPLAVVSWVLVPDFRAGV